MGNSSRHVNRKHKGTNGAVFSLCLRAPPDLDGLRMSLEQRYSRVGYVYQAICCVCVYVCVYILTGKSIQHVEKILEKCKIIAFSSSQCWAG